MTSAVAGGPRVTWADLPEAGWDPAEISGVWGFQATASFWTARQRQAHALHEVSYRACFKPQLPRFFIEKLTVPGDRVYDPFSGRGTTGIEAALLGRPGVLNDANPLGEILARPRFFVPDQDAVADRLKSLEGTLSGRADRDLSMFYHPDTESAIVGLKDYLADRRHRGDEDDVDRWIRMVATNRLTGHSPGFFSVYTLPPNQAASADRQRKINERLRQTPPRRDVMKIILTKSRRLMGDLSVDQRRILRAMGEESRFLSRDSRDTPEIGSGSVKLVVTSPPFLDVVQYAADNWLRFWFNGIDPSLVEKRLSTPRTLTVWASAMEDVFRELHRVVAPGGWVAFEVGEVRKGTVRLEETVVPLGVRAGFRFVGVLVNRQPFTKTSHIWGVRNNKGGTNTNRIALFEKK